MTLAPTTNMQLQKAEPSVTAGPTWAQMLNTLIDLIDAHDHSTGKGVLVTPSGLNINADLEFNDNDATELRSARLSNNAATLVTALDKGCVYRVGDNLYYNNSSGAAVQITSGTAVVSTITGAFAVTTPGGYPYTVTSADAQKVLLVDTGGARTITLPAATTAVMFCIKDITGTAFTNNITVARAGTDTIDGVGGNKTLNRNKGMWLLISDGVSAWHTCFMPEQMSQFSYVGTTGGTSTAYTATPVAPVPAYETGALYLCKFNAACGASPTLAISGLSALALVNKYGNALVANEVAANAWALLLYNGTNLTVMSSSLVTDYTCRVYRSSNYTISSGVATVLPFNAENYDTAAMHDLAVNTSRITFAKPGKYLVGASGQIASSGTTGYRMMRILLNGGGAIATDKKVPISGETIALNCSTPYSFAAGDYIDLEFYQNSGSNQDVVGSTNETVFWAQPAT